MLSTTAKVNARIIRKNKKDGAGDVDMSVIDPSEVDKTEEKKDLVEADKPEIPQIEPTEYLLTNPSRVLKQQEKNM